MVLNAISALCVALCVLVVGGHPAHAAGADAKLTVGQAEVFLLTEGPGEGKRELLLGANDAKINKYLPGGVYPTAVNAFLIRTPGALLLIDTGYGRKLFDNLKNLNISPEQIDAVLLTHMHPDHIGGLLREGKPAFSKAKVYVAEPERAYWTDMAIMAKMLPAQQERFKQVQGTLAAYSGRVQTFMPGELGSQMADLLPAIKAIAAFGHTPGHTMFLLGSGKDQLLFWGDLTHAMAIQMPLPTVAMTFDVDPKAAVASRLKVLRYVADNKLPVAGAHIPIPAIGSLAAQQDGFMFTPLP